MLLQLPKPSLIFISPAPFRGLQPRLKKNQCFFWSPFRAGHVTVRNSESNSHGISTGGAFSSPGKSAPVGEKAVEEENNETLKLFEELKNAEKERMNKMEKFENKANLLLERQAILGACWSKKLLTLQGKLKGTEMDPANSHGICFSDFLRLLNSDNVHYIEYSNFGQYISVILPYNKDEEGGEAHGNSAEEVIYRRHIVDRMPFDAWNDVWMKLHKQIIHVDVLNTNSVSVEVYSTIANAVVWAMRFVLSVGVYLCIDHICMPIYAKYIPCDLGTPEKPIREFLPHRSLGSLGKSRLVVIMMEFFS